MIDGKLERADVLIDDDDMARCFVGLTPREAGTFAWYCYRWVHRPNSQVDADWAATLRGNCNPATDTTQRAREAFRKLVGVCFAPGSTDEQVWLEVAD